jgi:hypothetical protein
MIVTESRCWKKKGRGGGKGVSKIPAYGTVARVSREKSRELTSSQHGFDF